MISPNWNVIVSSNITNMKNDVADRIKTNFLSFVISTNQPFLTNPQGILRNVNYSSQNTDNKSFNLNNNKTSVHTINVGANFLFLKNLNTAIDAGLISSSVFDSVKITSKIMALCFSIVQR